MLACVDGIAGVGKSTLLTWLERRALNSGMTTRRLHFFSDASNLRLAGHDDPVILEQQLLSTDMDRQCRADLFRRLCSLACDAFLSARESWGSSVTLFDRSPLSYYAYCEGVLGVGVKPWSELEKTIAVLRPIVVVGNVVETHRRVRLRDVGQTKGVFHRLSIAEDQKVQERFTIMASHFGLVCGDSDFAWNQLKSALQSEIDNVEISAIPD